MRPPGSNGDRTGHLQPYSENVSKFVACSSLNVEHDFYEEGYHHFLTCRRARMGTAQGNPAPAPKTCPLSVSVLARGYKKSRAPISELAHAKKLKMDQRIEH